MSSVLPFWETTALGDMSREQWESLCDGCGRCCLHKLIFEEAEEVSHTNVACRLLDLGTCRCSRYGERRRHVPDCVSLTPEGLQEINWLPPTCAYRRVNEGRGLAWWHPLVSGRADTVHEAGISVRGRAVGERQAGPLEHHVVDWPGREPRARKPAQKMRTKP